MRRTDDAFGHLLYDSFNGTSAAEIVEREDGFIQATGLDAWPYFTDFSEWPAHQKAAMSYVTGRVLDIGCGAGRHSLYLQEQGLEVVAVDGSLLAIEVCRLRGVSDARVVSITRLSSRLGTFDTLLMLGANFGLFANRPRARWLLRRFSSLTSATARIIVESRDPYATDEPAHLEYHLLNRQRGRMSGQVRIRIRYKRYATPWFDYLFVSKDEMREIVEGAGWRITATLDSASAVYIAVLEKAGAPSSPNLP